MHRRKIDVRRKRVTRKPVLDRCFIRQKPSSTRELRCPISGSHVCVLIGRLVETSALRVKRNERHYRVGHLLYRGDHRCVDRNPELDVGPQRPGNFAPVRKGCVTSCDYRKSFRNSRTIKRPTERLITNKLGERLSNNSWLYSHALQKKRLENRPIGRQALAWRAMPMANRRTCDSLCAGKKLEGCIE